MEHYLIQRNSNVVKLKPCSKATIETLEKVVKYVQSQK